MPNKEQSFSRFFQALPIFGNCYQRRCGPFPPCEFFLACPPKGNNAEHAADLFPICMCPGFRKRESPCCGLAEAGFALVDRRHEVAKALGNWQRLQDRKIKKDQYKSAHEGGHKAVQCTTLGEDCLLHTAPQQQPRRRRGRCTFVGGYGMDQGVLDDLENIPDATRAPCQV